jgi:DNA-binding NarL/FixJ family response regulator
LAQILLAEDNLMMRQLLKSLIESRAGWHICGETGDGYEAVAKATELKPDLVVLDFAMSRLNGLQVATKIVSSCPTLPIVMHTFHVFPAMITEAKKVGVREVVAKSETAQRLLGVIETLLKEKPQNTSGLLNSSLQLGSTDVESRDDKQKLPESN